MERVILQCSFFLTESNLQISDNKTVTKHVVNAKSCDSTLHHIRQFFRVQEHALKSNIRH